MHVCTEQCGVVCREVWGDDLGRIHTQIYLQGLVDKLVVHTSTIILHAVMLAKYILSGRVQSCSKDAGGCDRDIVETQGQAHQHHSILHFPTAVPSVQILESRRQTTWFAVFLFLQHSFYLHVHVSITCRGLMVSACTCISTCMWPARFAFQ